jgi:hypothetical protein
MVEGVLRESLAWWVTLHVDVGRLAALVCAAPLVSALAAALPALEARRVVPREVYAPE